MNLYQRRHVLNGTPWTEEQRINHQYAILRTERAKMADDDPRKNGIMLTRCRALEIVLRKLAE